MCFQKSQILYIVYISYSEIFLNINIIWWMASQNNSIILARDSLLIYELQIIYIHSRPSGDGIDKSFPPTLYHSSETKVLCLMDGITQQNAWKFAVTFVYVTLFYFWKIWQFLKHFVRNFHQALTFYLGRVQILRPTQSRKKKL